jgi:hypothetical protein
MTDELETIRRRHEKDEQAAEEGDGVPPLRLIAATVDRGDLLRLLDAARAELMDQAAAMVLLRAELREVREAAQKYEEDTRIFFNRPASGDRLAAALAKDAGDGP